MNVTTIGVVGLGLMGRSIAGCFLSRGFDVVVFDTQAAAYPAAESWIEQVISDLIERADFPPQLATRWRERYTPAQQLKDLADCHLVIEAIVEDLQAKRELFANLETFLPADVPIATNTSALPITTLQDGRQHPQRFVGMHWSDHAHIARFLELIRGDQTSDQALQCVDNVARQIGKEPSIVEKDVPAFICNRLGYAMYREAVHLLESGVGDAETIDRTFRNAFGLWAALCGPLRWMDISGGPALYATAMRGVFPTLNNATEVPETMRELQSNDARGTLNGRGFYEYGPGDRERWENLFREHAWHVRRFQDEYLPLESD